ncbi:hypothetical protein SAMN04487820_108205 [Actinopolyspora mzabensis]|uniref:Uncharacterized protein n=1 Tax=Actinopolyspora mzabensis TaxID=995066 RepID=A0A1G9CAT8_ACTMZ|nr:hypothetical protein SAMN04487820_108205 [Actinopolyspora mzabensis]
MAGVFLRALLLMFLGSLVCTFTGLGVPTKSATLIFFAALTVSLIKMTRLTLVVFLLMRGQSYDDEELPKLTETGR